MRVRIIAGLFGGRFIESPSSRRTHPMGERIRGAIFNRIQHELPQARVLDTFSGTGALGIESFSRGAKEVILVEKDRLAQKIISKNIALLHAEEGVTLMRSPVSAWLKSAGDAVGQFDIIFVDPPYWDPQIPTVERIAEHLAPDGLLIFSHPNNLETPKEIGTAVLQDVREYSGARIAFYRA